MTDNSFIGSTQSLQEGGKGLRFDVLNAEGETIPAFAIKFDYQYFCQSESKIPENQQLSVLNNIPENAHLLDLRELDEQPRLPNSDCLILIPLSELEAKASLLPKSETIVCVCQSGIRSIKGFHILKKLGFIPFSKTKL